MKEYIAKTGGRYTYVEDLLNLQELAVSMTAVFDGCSNFIISGCEVASGRITPGFVWINGKVRHFEGCADAAFPYYIYERNQYETISYAGDVNKHGRCNYLSAGATAVPEVPDEVTGQLPSFIEMKQDYSPRFIDKFFGRYAVLLETPFSKQTVKKDLVIAGNLTSEKDFESKTAVSVINAESGYCLKSIVKSSGDASVGVYENGMLVNEIVIGTDGSLSLYRQGTLLATIDSSGLRVDNLLGDRADIGSIRIQGNNIYNHANATEEGAVHVNRYGYNDGNSKFRNFVVYDGRTANPLLCVEGQHSKVSVNGYFMVSNGGRGISLKNPTYAKTEQRLTNIIEWLDKDGARLGYVGYIASNSFDLSVRNEIGNLVIQSNDWVDVQGELRVGGINIDDTYVKLTEYTPALSKKVDKVNGKQLSTEDFTSAYKAKLDSILTGSISTEGEGFVTAGDVAGALSKKLTIESNLTDLSDKAAARTNLDVYSRGETVKYFLKTTNYLSEITSLSASEIEGKAPEEIIAMKEQRQKNVRDNIDAERKGTGDLKLAKAGNLADLPDKSKARGNLNVYSIEDVDKLLSGKLGTDSAYGGAVFTTDHKAKLEGIKTGTFAGTDINGVSQTQVEGYVTTSAVTGQLALKAPRLLNGYSAADKVSIAENIGVYSKTEAEGRFGVLSQSLQDYINYHVKQGKSTTQAQQIIRDKLDAPAKADMDAFVRKDQRLSDLSLGTANDKRLACQAIGAACADEVQAKIEDTGWIACGGENAGTLWARQIGNIVCIQGTINTARRASRIWGSIATIPNQISPPRFGCRQTMADFNEDHKYNRGCSFVIKAGSRTILMHESGAYNVTTELHFSYMT